MNKKNLIRALIVLLAPALPLRASVPDQQATTRPAVASEQKKAPAGQQPGTKKIEKETEKLAAEVSAGVRAEVLSGEWQAALEAARAQSLGLGKLDAVTEVFDRALGEYDYAAMLSDHGLLSGKFEAARLEAELAMAKAQPALEEALAVAREQQVVLRGKAAGDSREQDLYNRGKSALDRGRWAAAIESFDAVAGMKGPKADGALYWKAYAQNRLGQRAESLVTLQELQKNYPKSAWLNDAKVLEMEVRQAVGQPVRPEAETDEDLKLLALNTLIRSEPERSIPMLEKVLQGDNSPRVKSRAIFVLSQSKSPQSREILARLAKGAANPDLQLEAVKYLGIQGSVENRQVLADIYAATSNVDVKRRVLWAFMAARDKERLLAVAKTETDPALRVEAVRQLGTISGGHEELYQLYRSDLAPEVRQQIISAMVMARSADRLLEIAKTEKEATLRAHAIRNLGMLSTTRARTAEAMETARAKAAASGQQASGAQTPATRAGLRTREQEAADTETATRIGRELVAIYKSDKDTDVRKAVVNALYMQRNAAALVEIARAETDPEIKKDIVQRLSTMKSKEATDYLMELLVK
ncbi:MAG: HEAT repeat domain-containing protein [Vicinamibacterales bacterium]